MNAALIISVLLISFQLHGQDLTGKFITDEYSIKYPESWSVTENKMGASLFILAPKTDDQDEFNEYVNLVIHDLEGTNLNLDSYIQLSQEQIVDRVDNVEITQSKRLKSGSLELHKMAYSGEINGMKLKLIQHYRFRNQKVYVITFTAEESAFEDFKKYGQGMLNSFRLK
ncbi:hypothetical protein [Ekhidna sp.]|uniref:hypothetical protein n=1 Tax=Ekhidna sp. TaxID=2608089 RepID=UPI003B51096E